MSNRHIQTIIFDLGGVLIDWNPRYLYRKIFDTEAQIESFLAQICTGDWNEQQDAGRPLATATQLLVDQHPEQEAAIRAFYDRWIEMLGGPIDGTVEVFRKLKAQGTHRLYALTNWSAETFPHALERYDFLGWFEGILVSGQEMMKKPDPRIYQLILDRYNIEPSTALFIDDSQRNVDGALASGIQAIRFESPQKLQEDLDRLL